MNTVLRVGRGALSTMRQSGSEQGTGSREQDPKKIASARRSFYRDPDFDSSSTRARASTRSGKSNPS
ncbi:MAG: hypothetical protein JXA37_05840, partial [Chloroflexia bacterium]|nr:hypothetical protein [Chloroflexia bacterium]